jgi:hopanoid-associated phosphorylase
MAAPPVIVAVTGLRFEADIAAGAGVRVVCQQNATLATHLDAALADGCAGVISFGTAGGLTDTLRPGDWVIARAVIAGTRRMDCDTAWSAALRRALPDAHYADLAGVPGALADPAAKRAVRDTTGAIAADMESHIAAALAQAHDLPFACCRVIIDPLERTLPPAALNATRTDGSTDIGAVLRSLLARPTQLPALLALARDAGSARRALTQGRARLGTHLGYNEPL